MQENGSKKILQKEKRRTQQAAVLRRRTAVLARGRVTPMPKSESQKRNYAQRRELRIRRDATAAKLLPFYLQQGLSPGAAIKLTLETTNPLFVGKNRHIPPHQAK